MRINNVSDGTRFEVSGRELFDQGINDYITGSDNGRIIFLKGSSYVLVNCFGMQLDVMPLKEYIKKYPNFCTY